jgi:hypothetical protein
MIKHKKLVSDSPSKGSFFLRNQVSPDLPLDLAEIQKATCIGGFPRYC